jgi:hypothetical protein
MFPAAPYSLPADIVGCKAQFNVTLRPKWPETHFGGPDFDATSLSNVIFSNGLLDPWHVQVGLVTLVYVNYYFPCHGAVKRHLQERFVRPLARAGRFNLVCFF